MWWVACSGRRRPRQQMTATVQTMTIAVDPRVGERWIRGTTTASVVLLAGIAAVVSYGHMHMLTVVHGESAWTAALIPLSVDGMIVASSMTLLADSRAGRSGGVLPWALLAAGSAASLAANVAAAEPTAYGRVIAAWLSFALIGAYVIWSPCAGVLDVWDRGCLRPGVCGGRGYL